MKHVLPLLILLLFSSPLAAEIPSWLRFEPGPINRIEIAVDGKDPIAINHPVSTKNAIVLLTHARRDVVASAAEGVLVYAPPLSREFLAVPQKRWRNWWEERLDYYGQQVPQWPTQPIENLRYIESGKNILIGGLPIHFLPTPGYTIDGTTYLVEIDGTKVAFTGDLILAGGQVCDLYSFQNEIPEARVGNYHGYLGRIAQWIDSLETLATEEPDLIVPSRGEVIANPADSIDNAIATAKEIYRNYLESNALHWYFGKDRMNTCAERVLGPDHGISGMPLAEHVELPDWCQHIGTTKLLVSNSGRGFVLDVGGKQALDTLRQIVADGLVSGIDGIFATHTHNDHTAAIAEAADAFDCPVYSLPEVAGPVRTPSAWFLPGLSPSAVPGIEDKADGETMKWEEFRLTFRFFPGQMWNHGALLVEKPGHSPVFFIGDSFSPTGIDDYCLMNRNLMGEDTGYLFCFRLIEELPDDTWLVNQHIPHLFRFSIEQREFLKKKYRERRDLIADFTPWDDPDYAVDPQWARFHPYGQTLDQQGEVALLIENHSKVEREFTVRVKGNDERSIRIGPRKRGALTFVVNPPDQAGEIDVITATITRDDGVEVRSFCEALVQRAD